ncbi:MAG: hypothetical protein SOU19_01980 [Candidatus Caccosoma sp.]|nr:hypothetical protein [Candidatus Caccosoma sp.]
MILYGIIIILSAIAITLINYFSFHIFSWYIYLLIAIILVIILIIIDGIFAGIIRYLLPKKFVNRDLKIYQVSKKEMKIYDFFKIKKWKDKIPELGSFTNFHKNKVLKPKDNEYVARFIEEACYGMWGHIVGAIMGFLILLLDFNMYSGSSKLYLTMFLPFAIVNFILDLLPAFVLRYNLNRLQALYKYNLKHQKEN